MKVISSVENYDEKTAENYKLFPCRIIQINNEQGQTVSEFMTVSCVNFMR